MKKETDPFLAEAQQVAFSEERHARLVDSLKSAPSRAVEVPFSRRSPWPIVTGLAAIAALSAFMWIHRPERVPTEVGRLGGTVLLAERSLAHFQAAGNLGQSSSAQQVLEPTADVMRFLSDQLSIARTLAPAARPPT